MPGVNYATIHSMYVLRLVSDCFKFYNVELTANKYTFTILNYIFVFTALILLWHMLKRFFLD